MRYNIFVCRFGTFRYAEYRNSAALYESGEKMAKKKSITRISDKKRGRPKIRFSIWGLILIFVISFSAWFIIYMGAANFNENFLEEEFGNNNEADSDIASAENNGEELDAAVDTEEASSENSVSKVTNPISQSEAKSAEYLSSCCLVTDSTLIDMAKYTELKDVIGNNELSAAGCNTVTIETSYGTSTAYELLQVKKPEIIYIMLGSDIGKSKIDDMISSYTEFVKNLRGYLPDAAIYIMQLPPVHDDANATIGNGQINEFNTKLLTIANMNNVYCIDTNTALKGVDGALSDEYRDSGTGALTESAYKAIADYILCHTV